MTIGSGQVVVEVGDQDLGIFGVPVVLAEDPTDMPLTCRDSAARGPALAWRPDSPRSVRRSADDLAEETFPQVTASELPSGVRPLEVPLTDPAQDTRPLIRWIFRQYCRDP